MSGHRFLEHMSDVYIEAWGETLGEAYREAALALYETISSPKAIQPKIERRVEAEGRDLQELLYDWLEKLIVLFDVEGFLASEIEAEVEEAEEGWRLRARLRGELYDPSRHPHGTHVKGVTYHLMMVEAEKPVKRLRFLLDI